MVSTRKKKNKQKRLLSQLDDTLNDFVISNSVNATVSDSEVLDQQTNGQLNDFERVDNNARQKQVVENNIDDQTTRAVSCAVETVEKRMHDAIWTAIDNVLIPKVEMTVKSITGSTGHWTNSEVQNPDRKYNTTS